MDWITINYYFLKWLSKLFSIKRNDARGICDGWAIWKTNIYWEDMIQITLLIVAECELLKDYYFKFKSKYLYSWNEEH